MLAAMHPLGKRPTIAKHLPREMLAVLNDHIRPPINIQNRRNKQTFGTYTFTINLVPLVLEETCFAGHTFEYKWKTKQKAQSRKCNAEMRKGNTCKGPSNHQIWAEHRHGRGQAQPPAHSAKAVPRRAGPGVAAPGVRAHRPHLLLAPPCTGGH